MHKISLLNKTNTHSIYYFGVSYMKIKWKELIIAVAIPLLVGGLSALLTSDSMQSFEQIAKPPLSPPGWLFPVVWTILYVLMGIASYLIYTAKYSAGMAGNALFFYFVQLIFNFFWSIIFFNWEMYLFAFIWLLALLALIIITTIKFYKISKPAAYLMIPYILWVTFAGYLNLGIYLLN